mgnify:CR=1 FL=1
MDPGPKNITTDAYNIESSGSTGLVWRFDPFEIEIVAKKNETIYLELKTFSVGFVHTTKIEVVDKNYALESIKSMQRVLRTDNP